MKRQKHLDTTATPTETERKKDADPEMIADPFEIFAGENAPIRLQIRRLEPRVENGITVSGFLSPISLDAGEAQNLVHVLSQRPGYGGGLYSIQSLIQQEDGKYTYGRAFPLRIAGRSRALELDSSAARPVVAEVMPAPPIAPPPPHHMTIGQPMGYPPPQYYPAPPPAMPSDMPQMIKTLGDFMARQNAPQMDMVSLIGALQRTVQGEDELTKFAKFAQMLQSLQPQQQAESSPKIDWVSMIGAAKEIFRPQPQEPAQPSAPMSGPPGWNWNPSTRRWVKAQAPGAEPVQGPPGWTWSKADRAWVRLESKTDPEPEPVEQNEEEDEGEEESDGPYTADQIQNFLTSELPKMDEREQEKLKEMVKSFAKMLE